MGRPVNATKSLSCQPHSRVTLALGQSKIYKPERDLSGVPSLLSEFSFEAVECWDHVVWAKSLVSLVYLYNHLHSCEVGGGSWGEGDSVAKC